MNERGADDEFRLHLEGLSMLDEDERRIIKELLECMILKHEAKRWSA